MSDEKKRPVRSGHHNKSGRYRFFSEARERDLGGIREAFEEYSDATSRFVRVVTAPWQPTRDEFIDRLRDAIRGMEQEINAVEATGWRSDKDEPSRIDDCAAIRRAALAALESLDELE